MVDGTVKSWDEDEGWGVLTSPDVPGEIFAHFSCIVGDGYRALSAGERVRFECEAFPPGQDGYFFRARQIARIAQ
jgi:CspA family cold shock protein